MAEINLTDSRGRDAVVAVEGVSIPLEYRWIDGDGAQAVSRKILRSTMAQDLSNLLAQAGGLDELGEQLIKGDPEVDTELFGCFLEDTSRVYVDQDKAIVHKVSVWDVVRSPDGTEKERRPKTVEEQNVSTETPLKWTGKLFKKADVYNRFVFSQKVQVKHVNGLTFDFLFSIARELEESESMMLVAGGAKASQPLIFRRGGVAYRGFLEGRTEGDKYALVLHLSNMELKQPTETTES
ncbi:MAG: hypothetical protein R3F19_20175 [Verrucomicrobiales bacterium]